MVSCMKDSVASWRALWSSGGLCGLLQGSVESWRAWWSPGDPYGLLKNSVVFCGGGFCGLLPGSVVKCSGRFYDLLKGFIVSWWSAWSAGRLCGLLEGFCSLLESSVFVKYFVIWKGSIVSSRALRSFERFYCGFCDFLSVFLKDNSLFEGSLALEKVL